MRSERPQKNTFAIAVIIVIAWVFPKAVCAAADPPNPGIRLELSPRICTLAAGDKQCETRVSAKWQSTQEESLCLVIVDRPDIKHCWENYAQGIYSIDLVFVDDLIFQLRDVQLERVLATEALRVIREAIRYRHKRRQPWSIFD